MSRLHGLSKFVFACAVASALSLQPVGAEAGSGFDIVHTFQGPDGAWPYGGLTRGKDGNFYGTTTIGGVGCGGPGCGTVYKLTPDGTQTVIYAFKNDADGREPREGTLIIDKQGNLYGTTVRGGNVNCGLALGCGTIFKVALDGTKTTLHVFQGGTDGESPYGGLVVDKKGNLYGATLGGGVPTCGDYGGCGLVFKLATDGTYTVLHAFAAGSDGAFPNGRVTIDAAGNLYGTTIGGGTGPCDFDPPNGCGTVFKTAPDGTTTILHSFQSGTEGDWPMAAVVPGPDGALYGTTFDHGDPACDCGTVFKLTQDGTLTTLHRFTGSDGGAPDTETVFDRAGDLFGTASLGGTRCLRHGGCGTVYEIDNNGVFRSLHSLNGGSQGKYPGGAVFVDRSGAVYGTGVWGANQSCPYGCGTLFKLKVK
jgi:uncharacterized repeat protein (TIGR03803 family)